MLACATDCDRATCSIDAVAIDKRCPEAFLELIAAGAGDISLPEVSPDDDATILFTSDRPATRARYRPIAPSRPGLCLFNLAVVLRGIWNPKAGHRPIRSDPGRRATFHVTGEVPVMLNSFVICRGMVLMPKWDAGEALRLIEKERITYFVGVPTMSLELMNHPDRGNYDLSTLTDIAAAGAPRPVSHVDRLRNAFPAAHRALGYRPRPMRWAAALWDNYAAKPASTGRAQVPFVEVAIRRGATSICLPISAAKSRSARRPISRADYAQSRGNCGGFYRRWLLADWRRPVTSTRTAICSS
jgi:hypothetical protein